MAVAKLTKVTEIPAVLEPNAMYLLQTADGLELHTVNSAGTATIRTRNKADIDAAIVALEAKQNSLANQPGIEPFFFGQ